MTGGPVDEGSQITNCEWWHPVVCFENTSL